MRQFAIERPPCNTTYSSGWATPTSAIQLATSRSRTGSAVPRTSSTTYCQSHGKPAVSTALPTLSTNSPRAKPR